MCLVCVLQELTEGRVEPEINVTNRVAKLGLRCRIVKKMGVIHELPQVMLYVFQLSLASRLYFDDVGI